MCNPAHGYRTRFSSRPIEKLKTKKPIQTKKFVLCEICNASVSATKTSYIVRHYRLNHPNEDEAQKSTVRNTMLLNAFKN